MWKIASLLVVFLAENYVLARCPIGWLEFGDPLCYHIGSNPSNFSAARATCKALGADLASIHGQTELKFLERYLTADHYWIGLNDRKTEGTFEHTDGTKVTFTKWQNKEPNSDGDCVDLHKNDLGYLMTDHECGDSYPFICKKKAPTWFPLKFVSMGKLPNIPGIRTYSLPKRVPKDAKKILLFVTTYSKYNPGHNEAARYRLFTKEGGYKFSKYISVHFFAHLHTTSNSQNIWLPVTSDRKVRVSYKGPAARRHLVGKVYLIGYVA